MIQEMSNREKTMMAILGLILLFCIYYFAFYTPMQNKIAEYKAINSELENEIVAVDAKAAKLRSMEEELKSIWGGKYGYIKPLPDYDNSKQVMSELSFLLQPATNFNIQFTGTETTDKIVRRNAALSYKCVDYPSAKAILTTIYEGRYRNMFKNLSFTSGDDGGYSVSVEVTYFEFLNDKKSND